MRLKILLFVFLLWGSVSYAQNYIYNDTINYLVITEYRGDSKHRAYLELTNMGNKPVQLNQFKIGHWSQGSKLDYLTGKTVVANTAHRIPVDKVLQPGESFVFAAVQEYEAKMFARGFHDYQEKLTQDKMWEYADFQVHLNEGGDSTDIITPGLNYPFDQQWGPGMNGLYIQQHFANGDSIVVDQVVGMFTDVDGKQLPRNAAPGYDVAGVPFATGNSVLVRRFKVKQGNRNFNQARGVGLDDSEWIPIPFHGNQWRDPMWTVGNHGDYKLDANTLKSNVLAVDFANKTLTVPWGIRRGDDIMNYLETKPGIGWEYVMGADADSLTHAVQTGDQLLVYVCGNDLIFTTFKIIAKEPVANANTIVARANEYAPGGQNTQIENGVWDWPRITQNKSGKDSIWGFTGGIPYATRVDTLLERLDKPANASWEIVYASGTAKADLAHGDKLKVTASNGSVKEYFISVLPYRANRDATLSAIQWPDIPEYYKGLNGWIGDTIPGFGSLVYNYNIEVPLDVESIPAFVATKSDPNAKVKVDRASNLSGSEQDRTITFTVTAEDDTTISNYNIVLTKQKDPDNLQPYYAKPFISEVSHQLRREDVYFVEICNPGNQPLDLSDYMLAGGTSANPAEVIANKETWLTRFKKYIPGYKWQKQADWDVNGPFIAEDEISVNQLVLPGDVFVMGAISYTECDWPEYPAYTQLDVQFANKTTSCYNWVNQWGEEVAGGSNANVASIRFQNRLYLFKILNDSVKQGLKPATNPNDFELIDAVGNTETGNWKIGGVTAHRVFSIRRKPGIFKGNPVLGGAMGSNTKPAEFTLNDLTYYEKLNMNGTDAMRSTVTDVGKHFFYVPTHYMSTVGSKVYKVSEGYGKDGKTENIKGITTGTKVSDFIANLIKKNEKQSLKVTSKANGSLLPMNALLTLNDTLTVLSADSTNTTKYALNVTAEGLSSNAVLSSTRYKITVDVQPKSAGETSAAGSGTVSGFDYGTSLRTIINNITVPAGASMDIINADGSYASLTQLNFDSTYVFVTVNSEIYLDVLAENGITGIKYRLTPESSPSSAFVLSNKYSVIQKELLIDFVPGGINVQSFISYLVASEGATIKLVDKMGFERIDGAVADDDKLVVTSADKTVTVVYHIGRLATQYVTEPTYLAYILSREYAIDQVVYNVAGVDGKETVSNFLTKVTPAAGASVAVVDKAGTVKINGDINGGDKVKVTSADGKIVVYYTFGPLTSTSWMDAAQIELYPNPSNGKLNVTGVEKGQRIQVYNSAGAAIIDINVESNHEIFSIEKHPAGLYMIVVSDENKLLGKYKAIKY
jgi:hypothetical protein